MGFEDDFWKQLFLSLCCETKVYGTWFTSIFWGGRKEREQKTQYTVMYRWLFVRKMFMNFSVLSYSNSVSKKKHFVTMHFILLNWIPRPFLKIWIRDKTGKIIEDINIGPVIKRLKIRLRNEQKYWIKRVNILMIRSMYVRLRRLWKGF